MRQNRLSLLPFSKFNKGASILPSETSQKHCWSYSAIRRIQLVGLVKWQGWCTCISI